MVPSLTWVFRKLKFISPLTIVRHFIRRTRQSHLAVEIYVVVCFSILLLLIWPVSVLDPLSLFGRIFLAIFLVWRQLDILQAWYNTFLKEEVKAISAVRSLALATINYLELAVIFGLLTFIFRSGNFYPGIVTITESLRHSIGVITTIGSRFDPATPFGSLLYYSEVVFGLVFLVVIIARVILLFKPQ